MNEEQPTPKIVCPECGGELRLTRTRHFVEVVCFDEVGNVVSSERDEYKFSDDLDWEWACQEDSDHCLFDALDEDDDAFEAFRTNAVAALWAIEDKECGADKLKARIAELEAIVAHSQKETT